MEAPNDKDRQITELKDQICDIAIFARHMALAPRKKDRLEFLERIYLLAQIEPPVPLRDSPMKKYLAVSFLIIGFTLGFIAGMCLREIPAHPAHPAVRAADPVPE